MYQYIVAARSKLKNFAPKILLCAQLIVLSIRNANIVRQTNRQTGIYLTKLRVEIWEFLLRQAAKPSDDYLIKYIIINMINYHTYHNSQLSILNSQLNKLQITSSQDKHRRLWRPAIAPQPPIAETPISTVSRWDTYPSETHCKLRRSAAVG